jgi:alpha-2-macroglobulin
VKNVSTLPSVKEIALVQVLPSGWEIENVRLLGESLPPWAASLVVNKEDYLDIRDDRVMWFFDLYEDHSTLHNEMDFVIKLNTVTLGEFDLPPTLAEAMYNDNFKAVKAGNKVKVVK